MSDILVVTNRSLCRENFYERIENLAKARPAGMILREKDLSEEAYGHMAEEVAEICRAYGTRCILHTFVQTAKRLGQRALHLPMSILRDLSAAERADFEILGASCHSTVEAEEAETLGCTYITAGHIFETDCKCGLPGRGLAFLSDVCARVSIPVYAIGGISPENIASVRAAGAAGACVMSGAMTCADAGAYLRSF